MKLQILLLLFSFSLFSSEYIVKLKPGAKEQFTKGARAMSPKVFKTSFGEFATIKINSRAQRSLLERNPWIEYYEENMEWYIDPIYNPEENYEAAAYTPADDLYPQQWALNNTGANSGSFWDKGVAGMDVNAENAWTVLTGHSGVKIAVIDTGVDYTHEDLIQNMWYNEAEYNGQPGVDDDGNGYVDDIYGYDFANDDGDPMDGHGHGTHCAGVIGADHNGSGVAGLMSDVQIVAIKFLTDSGSGSTDDAIRSIDYAIQAGVHIMSNSWGGGGESQALREAIERARDAGILFVAAAGNNSSNNDSRPMYPASYDVENVISVGSMDGKGKASSFSNYGATEVDVFAPGSGILSTVQNNEYRKMSGTSMATPYVSGALGLLVGSMQEFNDIREYKERIINTSIIEENLVGKSISNGRIDTYRMLMNIID